MRNEEEMNKKSVSGQPKKLDVIEERLVVSKEKVQKGKVVLHKRVIEEEVPVDLELTEEHIDVEVKKIHQVVDKPGPAVREEGDTKIYSVYREVYVKQTILEEEVRITRKQTRKPFHTSEKLRREVIDVERISAESNDRENFSEENRNRRSDSGSNLRGDSSEYNDRDDVSDSRKGRI